MHFLQFESERGQTWPLQRQQLCCSDYDGWVRNGGGFGFKADSLLFKASKGLSPSLGRFAKICQGAAKIGIQRVALRPRPFQRSSTRLRCRRSRVATRCPFIIALQTDTIYILVQALAKLLQQRCGLNDKHLPNLKRRRRDVHLLLWHCNFKERILRLGTQITFFTDWLKRNHIVLFTGCPTSLKFAKRN